MDPALKTGGGGWVADNLTERLRIDLSCSDRSGGLPGLRSRQRRGHATAARQFGMALDGMRRDIVIGRKEQKLLPEIHRVARVSTERTSRRTRCEQLAAAPALRRHLAAVRLEYQEPRVADLSVVERVDHLLRAARG
jgi:hypothetical protein